MKRVGGVGVQRGCGVNRATQNRVTRAILQTNVCNLHTASSNVCIVRQSKPKHRYVSWQRGKLVTMTPRCGAELQRSTASALPMISLCARASVRRQSHGVAIGCLKLVVGAAQPTHYATRGSHFRPDAHRTHVMPMLFGALPLARHAVGSSAEAAALQAGVNSSSPTRARYVLLDGHEVVMAGRQPVWVTHEQVGGRSCFPSARMLSCSQRDKPILSHSCVATPHVPMPSCCAYLVVLHQERTWPPPECF